MVSSELVSFFDIEALDEEHVDERHNTAFHLAARYGQLETLQKMVTLFEQKWAKAPKMWSR